MATARIPRITGAFHGAMPTTTPTGCRIAMAVVLGEIRGNHFTHEGVRLRGTLFQQAAGVYAVEHPPAESLTGLKRHDLRDILHLALENIGSLQQQVAAHAGSGGAPRRKCGGCRLDRAARVFAFSRRHL